MEGGDRVAPPVGAWIETLGFPHNLSPFPYVAPPVGAWIETFYAVISRAFDSRAPRGRVD